MTCAYIVIDVDVNRPEQYELYKKLSTQAMRVHGAEVLARGGRIEVLEGRKPDRIVLLKFASLDAARGFYHSTHYQRARHAREGAAAMNMMIVEGI